MADHDGFTTGGYIGGGVTETISQFGTSMFMKSPLLFTLAFTILLVLVIIFVIYWLWNKFSKESISQITRQEGIERLSTGSLETGYASDPNQFCASAGTMDTSDPYASMYEALKKTDSIDPEGLTDYGKGDYRSLGVALGGR